MSKKNTTESGTLPGTPARTRTVKPKSETVILLQAQLSEAKKLDKLIAVIPELSLWGIGQVRAAVIKRSAILDPETRS